jgi:hypothetical protein
MPTAAPQPKPFPWWIAAALLTASAGCSLGPATPPTNLDTQRLVRSWRPGGKEVPAYSSKSGKVKGLYPTSTWVVQGRTAEEWGEQAKSKDATAVSAAAGVLHDYRQEGIPFLLEAVQSQENLDNIETCLAAIDGALLDEADVPVIAVFLGKEYSTQDAGLHNPDFALTILEGAGPKARAAVAQLKDFLANLPPLADVPPRDLMRKSRIRRGTALLGQLQKEPIQPPP